MKRMPRRTLSIALSLCLLCGLFGPGLPAAAQQAAGSAPFVNTWLVAGPFDRPVADIIYGTVIPKNPNIALEASATASSIYGASNPAGNAIDGSIRTQWVTANNDFQPWIKIAWQNPVSIGAMTIAQWGDGRHVNQYYHLTFTFQDGSHSDPVRVDSISGSSSVPTPYTPAATLENVTAVLVEVDKGRTPYPSITGISDIGVYALPLEHTGGGTPTGNSITPARGGTLTAEGQSNSWAFFDDRLWNRNYDDYQDLYGFYTVKQGIDTRGQYVYAHTYVFSATEQSVQFRAGSSGSYRLYVNDSPITTPSVPVEVQKDLTTQTVALKAGWNKLLIQIEHTYTEDLNTNGVPIGQDQHVAYLGFYGRVTDASGNTVTGLEYSVSGPTPEQLAIETGPLPFGENSTLPDNSLPPGYADWPYVWITSMYTNQFGISASAFRFAAGGGEPGYTWSLAEDSSLPAGLTLHPDGTVGGTVQAEIGRYSFTVCVRDKTGATAEKEFVLQVKDRPNRWFEEGRVGALTHCAPIPSYFVDPNYSADLWAERARRQGHSLVSVETLQQNYYWPSKFADPKHIRQEYLPKQENGQVVDGLKQFTDAVKRYGMRLGLYYATEGGGLQHNSTDVFFQNVEDLIRRYDPDYLYFDGPQAMKSANYDVMFSLVRDYSDEIIINSNATEDYGDTDLRTAEASGIYEKPTANKRVKLTIMEPWKSIVTKNNYTPYYHKRDDFRQVTKEMIINAARGMVDNNDQMPIMDRGSNFNTPEEIATRYPKAIQEYIDVREGLAQWFAPAGKPERHESTTGTTPYFLDGCGYTDDGKGNRARFENAEGPKWGYATSRDNSIYLHIISGPDGRTGFQAIGGVLEISPVKDTVTEVVWLNEGTAISDFEQVGETLKINLAGVSEDPIDTIVKVVTDNPARKYKLTNLTLTGDQLSDATLRINTEGYMTYPALKAKLHSVGYSSSDPAVAAVDSSGVATAGADGSAVITVTASCEGVQLSETLPVKVTGGKIYVGEPLLGASLWVGGREMYGEFSCGDVLETRIEGRSQRGGPVGLAAAGITYHTGIVDLKGGDRYVPIKLADTDLVRVRNGEVLFSSLEAPARVAVWADVSLDGKTYTTNRVYLDVLPEQNLTGLAALTASANNENTGRLTDRILIDGVNFDASKWSVDGADPSWVSFELAGPSLVSYVAVSYNTLEQKYRNMPKKMELQLSDDGVAWRTVSSVTPPGGTAYFPMQHVYDKYEVNAEGKYFRLNFPEGGAGQTLELLEVAIYGRDIANELSVLKAWPELAADGSSAAVGLKGYNGLGAEMDLSEAEVEIHSGNAGVVEVRDGKLYPVNEGKARIDVTVRIGRSAKSVFFYLDVDGSGKLQVKPYLHKISLALTEKVASPGRPAVAKLEAWLDDGEALDLSKAGVTYTLGDARLSADASTGRISMAQLPALAFQSTVRAAVTFDGITLESALVPVYGAGINLAPMSAATATSVRGNYDARYVPAKAIDGDRNTSWASHADDRNNAPWIRLDFPEPVEISKINLIDRGHEVNLVGEGLLEWEGGSRMVKDIQWNGRPDNLVLFDELVTTSWVKFTIDPNNVYPNGTDEGGNPAEIGLSELEVFGSVAVKNPLTVSVSTPTLVETLAANLNIAVTGEALESRSLRAYLKTNGELLYPTPILEGKGRMIIPAAPASGTACEVVVVEDGAEKGGCPITLAAYRPAELWAPALTADEATGHTLIVFSEGIAHKKGGAISVMVDGASAAYTLPSDGKSVLVDVSYASLPQGARIVISGVKYPALFPSYSFTFTVSK